jgi:hypothetical protein
MRAALSFIVLEGANARDSVGQLSVSGVCGSFCSRFVCDFPSFWIGGREIFGWERWLSQQETVQHRQFLSRFRLRPPLRGIHEMHRRGLLLSDCPPHSKMDKRGVHFSLSESALDFKVSARAKKTVERIIYLKK